MSDRRPQVTNFSLDIDDIRIPTIVPGNERLRADLVSGGRRNDGQITEDEITRALRYAIATGVFKPADQPISPLGSEFDFPQRITEQPHLFYSTGKVLGGNWFDNQIAYPETRRVTLGEK